MKESMKEIAIIGTSHEYQLPENADSGEFEMLIGSILGSSNFAAIVEEMSYEALLQKGASQSVCKRVADGRDIPHLYCDPDNQTRNDLEIRAENDIQAAGFLRNLSEQEISQQVLTSRDRREQYWLDQILELDCWPVLFICGANHVDSFSAKVRVRGLSAKILRPDWGPR